MCPPWGPQHIIWFFWGHIKYLLAADLVSHHCNSLTASYAEALSAASLIEYVDLRPLMDTGKELTAQV